MIEHKIDCIGTRYCTFSYFYDYSLLSLGTSRGNTLLSHIVYFLHFPKVLLNLAYGKCLTGELESVKRNVFVMLSPVTAAD